MMNKENASRIVDKIVEDLCGRLGLSQKWEEIHPDIQWQVIERWTEIVMAEANR